MLRRHAGCFTTSSLLEVEIRCPLSRSDHDAKPQLLSPERRTETAISTAYETAAAASRGEVRAMSVCTCPSKGTRVHVMVCLFFTTVTGKTDLRLFYLNLCDSMVLGGEKEPSFLTRTWPCTSLREAHSIHPTPGSGRHQQPEHFFDQCKNIDD